MPQINLLENMHSIDSDSSTWHLATEHGILSLAFPCADIVRIAFIPTGTLPQHSWSLRPDFTTDSAVHIDATRTDVALILQTNHLTATVNLTDGHVTIVRRDGSIVLSTASHGMIARQEDGMLSWDIAVDQTARIYGGGLRTHGLNQRGRTLALWNTDPAPPHDDDTNAMYQSINFFLIGSSHYHGIFFDTSYRGSIALGSERDDTMTYRTAAPELVAYICVGPTPAATLEQYTHLTGRMPALPRWSFGYQQSRWSYMTSDDVMDIATKFRENQIPCDAIYLDIDYMDGYRDFTWNKDRFPDLAGFIAESRMKGIRIVPIIDPGVKVDPNYAVYQEGIASDYFVRNPDGTSFAGWVWPGLSVWADFARPEVRHWWMEKHRGLIEAGVAGIWDDMNEPAQASMSAPPEISISHGATLPDNVQHGSLDAPISHIGFHNVYGLEMAHATYDALYALRAEVRPFVLTRVAAAGSQRYGAIWNGDNTSIWPHVSLAVTFNVGIGLSGFPMSGCDIGGFWQDTDPELLTRFTQVGSFLPFCRNHSCKGTVDQEPWAFGEPFTQIMRTAIERRYRLLPLYMTLAHEASSTGAPIIRPLFWHYDDPTSANCENEFLVGENLLVAPVLQSGVSEQQVYLPAGEWCHWDTEAAYTGNQTYTLPITLNSVPTFVKSGTVLPLAPIIQHTDEPYTSPLELHVYLADQGTARGTLWDDDDHPDAISRGSYSHYRFAADWQDDSVTVTIQLQSGSLPSRYPSVRAILHLPTGIFQSNEMPLADGTQFILASK